MNLRRGFKKEAEWLAVDVRTELRLAPHSPLCPWQLAELLACEVYALSELAPRNPQIVSYFTNGRGHGKLSAITLPYGKRRWIIYNDSNDEGRQAADISHECAHALLIHPLPLLTNAAGLRHYDSAIEEEASWLGPTLLVPDAAALLIARNDYTLKYAAELYGVSTDLMRFRLNVTAARRRAA